MSMLDAALALAAEGTPVFPCRADNKRPLVAHGFKEATTDYATIKRLWKRWPLALIGVPSGITFVALDIDLQHAEAARWYGENASNIPFTRKHFTRSGGFHLLFAPDARVRCTAGRIALGIDTRGLGGYVVWWLACGFSATHQNLLVEIPEFVVEALLPSAQPPGTMTPPAVAGLRDIRFRLYGIIRRMATAREGERNSVTFWGACRLSEMVDAGELTQGDAIGLAVEAASRTGLSRQEAERTVRSAFERGML